jgi:hypothetical protein
MKILRKAGALQSHLSSNLSKLGASTTIIISSAPAPPKSDNPKKFDNDLKSYQKKLEHHIGQSHFYPSMQFNLKTISYGNKTLSAAYPTKVDVDAAVELMKRTGARNIIGAGSGAAIDLAKACHYKYLQEDGRNNGSQLILNPSTLGAALTASSRDCLYLCPEEEALIPIYANAADINLDATTVVVDEKAISIPNWVMSNDSIGLRGHKGNNATIVDSVLASLVIALDAAHSMGGDDELDDATKDRMRQSLHECVTSAMLCLNNMESSLCTADSKTLEPLIETNKELALNSVLNAGKLLSFGHDSSLTRRNISLALTSSLLPEYFPHGNWNTFTASLLPGICHAIEENPDIADAEENHLLLDIVSKITGRDKSDVSFSHLTEWMEKISKDGKGFIIPSLSSLADGAPDASELISKVEDNGAFLQSRDADVEYLQSLLVSSLNR